MPEDPPTRGGEIIKIEAQQAEIMRIVVKIEASLAEILREIKADRVEAAKTYVRQDVHLRAEQLTNAHIADIRTDVTAVNAKVENHHEWYKQDRKADATTRRQMWMWIGGIGVTLLLGIGTLLVSFLTLLR